MRAKDVTKTTGVSIKKSGSKSFGRRFGTHIRIGRKDYTIIYCDEILDDEGNSVAGMCLPHDHIILVDVRREVEATLLHELAHAELFEAGFHQRGTWCSDTEEQIVEVLSQSIAHSFTLRKKT